MTLETIGNMTHLEVTNLSTFIDDSIGVDYEVNEFDSNEFGITIFELSRKEVEAVKQAEENICGMDKIERYYEWLNS